MMILRVASGALFLSLLLPAAASAQDFPTIPASLENAAGILCVRVTESGEVADAFVVTSTGDTARDNDMLAWVRRLRLPPAEPGKAKRDIWSPMPIAFGDARLPSSPKSCAPAVVDGAALVPTP